MEDKPEPISKIEITDNLIQFFDLLLKVDNRISKKRTKEDLL